MEIISNELSYYPVARSNNEAEQRFVQLFETFKEANAHYGFKKIRVLSDFSNQMITSELSFFQWLETIRRTDLKRSILTFFTKPFADDLNDDELEEFFESDYLIAGDKVPTDKSPVGFPIAHIRSKLTLSFDSDPFWRKRKIKLLKTNTTITENVSFTVYNICVETDLKSKEIREWADKVFSNTIDSKETLLLYLSFSKYEISFGDDFLSQLFEWKEVNR